jgi:hypothetical protein
MILMVPLGVIACIGGNGPDADKSGKSYCEQLKECQCDPQRTTDVATCESQYDQFVQPDGGQDVCRALLQGFSGCGQGVQVDPSRVDL